MELTVTVRWNGEDIRVSGSYEPAEPSSLYDPGESEFFDISTFHHNDRDVTTLICAVMSDDEYLKLCDEAEKLARKEYNEVISGY